MSYNASSSAWRAGKGPWRTGACHGWDPIHPLVGLDDSGITLTTLMTLFLYRLHELIQLPELLIYLPASATTMNPHSHQQKATNRSSSRFYPCRSSHPSMNRLRSFERTFAIPSGSRSAEKDESWLAFVSELEGKGGRFRKCWGGVRWDRLYAWGSPHCGERGIHS